MELTLGGLFEGAGPGMGGVRYKSGMGPQAGDSQQLHLSTVQTHEP